MRVGGEESLEEGSLDVGVIEACEVARFVSSPTLTQIHEVIR